MVERGTPGRDVDPDLADRRHETLVAEVSGRPARALLSPPAAGPGELLTADEVGRALGLTVVHEPHTLPGPMGGTSFRTGDRKRSILLLQVVDGPFGALAWRSNSRGQAAPGIGDGAWLNGNRAVARRGDTVVVITLLGQGKGHGAQLADLLRQATARIPVGAPS